LWKADEEENDFQNKKGEKKIETRMSQYQWNSDLPEIDFRNETLYR